MVTWVEVAVPPFAIARTPPKDPRVRQLPESAKHPAAILMPFAAVVVAEPRVRDPKLAV